MPPSNKFSLLTIATTTITQQCSGFITLKISQLILPGNLKWEFVLTGGGQTPIQVSYKSASNTSLRIYVGLLKNSEILTRYALYLWLVMGNLNIIPVCSAFSGLSTRSKINFLHYSHVPNLISVENKYNPQKNVLVYGTKISDSDLVSPNKKKRKKII